MKIILNEIKQRLGATAKKLSQWNAPIQSKDAVSQVVMDIKRLQISITYLLNSF